MKRVNPIAIEDIPKDVHMLSRVPTKDESRMKSRTMFSGAVDSSTIAIFDDAGDNDLDLVDAGDSNL